MALLSPASSHSCTLGLVLPLWSDTQVYLDGDGGFSVTSGGQSRIFKPVSIQTMWATLQGFRTRADGTGNLG